MTAPNNLEIKGNLNEFPLAELLVDIFQARLNGSLRAFTEAQKVVVYFDAGEVVFAVSNARSFRLFEIILREGKIAKEEILTFADFTNDFLLGQYLLKNNLLTKTEIDALFVGQIGDILKNTLDWRAGEWIFSPLVRIKGDIRFRIRLNQLLMEYVRVLPDKTIVQRFKSLHEVFSVKPATSIDVNLSPAESFVLSRFEADGLSVENVMNLSGLPDGETFKILYTLWLGGLLNRQNSNSAFSDRKTSQILSANISLVKNHKPLQSFESAAPKPDAPREVQPETLIEKIEPVNDKILLEQYLARVENSANFYEVLAIEQKAAPPEIKQAYFSLAKRFHPDLFHKEADKQLQQRVQQAFSKLAQAYDTLRYEKNREVYDFKMRKELEAREKRPKTSTGAENPGAQKNLEQATDDFEQGFNLLMDEDFEAATPFLARAAHQAKDNARFRAYYGKALAADSKQLHKAEAELQAAVRLEDGKPDFRLMLAEFFIQVGLQKRAEGELNRLLAAFPGNSEAKSLLDSLRKK